MIELICLALAFIFSPSHDASVNIDDIVKRKVCRVLQVRFEDLAIIGRRHSREPIVIFALDDKFSLQRFNGVKKSLTRDENIDRARSLLEVLCPNFSLGEVLDVRVFVGEDYTLKFFFDGRNAYLFYYGGE